MAGVGSLNRLCERVICSAECFQLVRQTQRLIFAQTHSMIRHNLKPLGIFAEAGQKCGGRLDILNRIIDAGDERLTENDVCLVLQEQGGISQDLSIGLPGVIFVGICIHMLQIEQKMIRDRNDFEQRLRICHSASLNAGIDQILMTQLKEFPDELRPKQRFSSRNRNAAARTIVEHLVAPDCIPDLGNRPELTMSDQCSVGTMIPAIAAGFAARIIDAVLVIRAANRIIRADFQACAAIYAEGLNKTHLRFH